MDNKLPCGCIPGEFLCPEAERLWNRCTTEYEQVKATNSREAWDRFVEARLSYDDHLGGGAAEHLK